MKLFLALSWIFLIVWLEPYGHLIAVVQTEAEEKVSLADRLHKEGHELEQKGNYPEALAKFAEGLKVVEGLGDPKAVADHLLKLGHVYARQHNHAQAAAFYQRAHSQLAALGDMPRAAQALDHLGVMVRSQGLYGKAVEHHQRALSIMEDLSHEGGMITTLNHLGDVYMRLDLYRQALEYHGRALKIVEALGVKKDIANTLANIASVYGKQELYGEAGKYYQQALKIMEEAGDEYGTAKMLYHVANASRRQGLYGEAIEVFQRALEISRSIGAKSLIGRAINGIGSALLRRQEFSQAVKILPEALALGDELKDSVLLLGARRSLASGYEKLGQPALALNHYQLAFQEIEKLRMETESDEAKAGLLANNISVYEGLIQLLHQLDGENPAAGYGRQAFEYAERAKARALLDLLGEARLDVHQGIDPELWHKKSNLEVRLSFLHTRLQHAHAQTKKNDRQIAEWEAERDVKYRAYQQLQQEIRRRHPKYADLQYPQPVAIEPVQRLLDEQTALLSYVLTAEAAYLFVLTQQEYRFYRLASHRKELEALIREQPEETAGAQIKWLSETKLQELGIRQALRHPPASRNRPPQFSAPAYYNDHFLQRGRQLYQRLLQPAEDLLKDKKHWIIVPDGILAYLPFEVLLTRASKPRRGAPVDFSRLPYVIQTHSIHYVPSASVWASLKTPRETGAKPAKELLAFGDPAYAGEGERAGGTGAEAHYLLRTCSAPFQPLSYSREEVQRIAKLYPAGAVSVYLGADAKEENLKKERLEDYRRIHLATHGCLNENKPEFSSLVLSPSGGDEDGFLQLYEVYNLKLNADLVVLSACVTGLGKEIRGEGLIGLTRGFLYAGTASVVASLWSVSDYSSATFMEKFYRHLPSRDKAEALRAVKREIIQRGIKNRTYYSHPFFWSAFVLMGERN